MDQQFHVGWRRRFTTWSMNLAASTLLAAELLVPSSLVKLEPPLPLPEDSQASAPSELGTGPSPDPITAATPAQTAAVQAPIVQPQASILRLQIQLHRREVTLYRDGHVLKRYPVGIGRPGWETPLGRFWVQQMQHNPTWISPFTGEIIEGGSQRNPMGHHWIGFWTNGQVWVGFHGTLDPSTVGRPMSHGCLHMYGQDLAELFSLIKLGTEVTVLP